MNQYDFIMDLEPRITKEVNPFGKVQYTVGWFSVSGAHRPEPFTWSFKSLRKAEKFAAKRQKERFDRAFRQQPPEEAV